MRTGMTAQGGTDRLGRMGRLYHSAAPQPSPHIHSVDVKDSSLAVHECNTKLGIVSEMGILRRSHSRVLVPNAA